MLFPIGFSSNIERERTRGSPPGSVRPLAESARPSPGLCCNTQHMGVRAEPAVDPSHHPAFPLDHLWLCHRMFQPRCSHPTKESISGVSTKPGLTQSCPE